MQKLSQIKSERFETTTETRMWNNFIFILAIAALIRDIDVVGGEDVVDIGHDNHHLDSENESFHMDYEKRDLASINTQGNTSYLNRYQQLCDRLWQ